MLCHHTGTRAPVPTTMRDTGGMLKIFKLVYSVVRRAKPKFDQREFEENHKEAPTDRHGCSLQGFLFTEFC